jgi:hypothetical protein
MAKRAFDHAVSYDAVPARRTPLVIGSGRPRAYSELAPVNPCIHQQEGADVHPRFNEEARARRNEGCRRGLPSVSARGCAACS